MVPLAEVYRRLRKERGLTQEEVAQRAGLPAPRISEIERGEIQNPSLDRFSALARGLDMTPAQLMQAITDEASGPALGESGTHQGPNHGESTRTMDETLRLLTGLWGTLGPESQEAVLQYMWSLRSREAEPGREAPPGKAQG